jgi:hypothetical protein
VEVMYGGTRFPPFFPLPGGVGPIINNFLTELNEAKGVRPVVRGNSSLVGDGEREKKLGPKHLLLLLECLLSSPFFLYFIPC